MNPSFVLVVLIGFCSFTLSAPVSSDMARRDTEIHRREATGTGNWNFAGAPDFDSILPSLHDGTAVFNTEKPVAGGVSRRQATNFAGAPEFDPILEGLRNGASVFNPESVPERHQVNRRVGSSGAGAPSFSSSLTGFDVDPITGHFRHHRELGSTFEQAIPESGNPEVL